MVINAMDTNFHTDTHSAFPAAEQLLQASRQEAETVQVRLLLLIQR